MDAIVIQALCWEYRCEEAWYAGAERGYCTCPCHDLESQDAVADFAQGLSGEE